MSEQERRRSEREARRDVGARPERPSGHDDALLRYLGGAYYAEEREHEEQSQSASVAGGFEGKEASMPPGGPDAFNHALHTANMWLADIGSVFGTRDRRYAQRALRAWLHTLRDRLTLDAAAKFGTQLPELVRGAYYEGWVPSRVPVKYGVEEYMQRFAAEAGIRPAEVPAAARTITDVLADHMSAGQLSETLAGLPVDLRAIIAGTPGAVHSPGISAVLPETTEGRMARLEDQVASLTEAMRSLAHGLEDSQLGGVGEGNVARAARLADEILIAAGSRPIG